MASGENGVVSSLRLPVHRCVCVTAASSGRRMRRRARWRRRGCSRPSMPLCRQCPAVRALLRWRCTHTWLALRARGLETWLFYDSRATPGRPAGWLAQAGLPTCRQSPGMRAGAVLLALRRAVVPGMQAARLASRHKDALSSLAFCRTNVRAPRTTLRKQGRLWHKCA